MSEPSLKSTYAQIDAACLEFAQQQQIPGTVTGIVRDGELAHVTTTGLADIEAALDQRPNQVPLIHALEDTVKFQKRNQARASGAKPQSPIVIGGPGGLPPGLVPGTGGSQIPLG